MPEILGRLRTPRLASPPSSPVPGEVYYDTVLSQLLYWDGTKWNQGPIGTAYDSDYIGTIKAFAGPAVPTNWMLCDGRTLDKILFPELFAVIGYKYGGSGNNFLLPDLRSKFVYGVAQADLSDLGAGGGVDTVVLTIGQIPAHAHAGSSVATAGNFGGSTDVQGNHFHTPTVPTDVFMLNTGGQSINFGSTGNIDERCTSLDQQTNTTGAHSHNVSLNNHSHGLTIVSEGGGQAHENLPPYIRMAQIIKVTGAQINAGGALVGPQGPKGDPGPWRGAWSAATAYSVGDSVSYYDGTVTGSYRRKVAGTTAGNPKTDTTNWEIIASGGSIGVDGIPGTVPVYEQASQPSDTTKGAIWIDTDDVAPVYMGSPFVTSLPSNPVDGQEVYFLADATAGVIWHLRYRASSASAYKWEYLGGPPLRGFYATNENIPATWASGQPSITVPRAGEYDVDWSCDVNSPGQSQNYIAFYLDAVRVDAIVVALFMTANPQEATGGERNRVAIAAGQVVSMGFIRTGAAVSSSKNRSLHITPVRIA